MKHLLIILSILLLSSFLISCEKKEETLYQWKTSSGYEWKEIGDKDTQIQYRGFVDDGSPEGLGVMTFPDGRKHVVDYLDIQTLLQRVHTWVLRIRMHLRLQGTLTFKVLCSEES